MKKKLFKIFYLLVLLVGLSACGNTIENSVSSSVSLTPNDVNTNYTDTTKLTRSFVGKKFTTDGIGEVTLGTVMDGDTVHFFEDHLKVKLRFIGANTPESTGKMEPWGKPASIFVRDLLNTEGIKIVLENDVEVFGQKDNNGNRYLGFVWYKLPTATDYRLLNLELVELGYSPNQLFKDSTLCNYRQLFDSAEEHARACGAKVHGEEDKTFDYSNEVHAISLRKVREEFETYGAVDTSGKQLRITALVVGMIGDNMVLRDVDEDARYDDGTYAGMYAYAAYNSSLASVVGPGMVVEFNCRATSFNGAIQLSDLKTSFITTKNPFKIVCSTLEESQLRYPDANLDPIVIEGANYNAYNQLNVFVGFYIETYVTIRVADRDEYDEDGNPITVNSYFNKDANKNITIYAYLKDSTFGNNSLVMNLRVDGSMNPYVSEDMFEVGETYKVRGYINPYFDKYQIQLFNNVPKYNYIEKVIS